MNKDKAGANAKEDQYRRIIDNIKLGLIEVDANEIIQFANQSFLDLTGYSLDELIGKNASETLINQHDQEAVALIQKQNESRKSGQSSSYEIQILDKQNKLKWVVVSGAPNYDREGNLTGSIGIHMDISEAKKLREEIEFRSLKLQKLFEKSLDALITVNAEGHVIEWSPQAEKIFGFSFKEVEGKSLDQTIIPHQFRAAHTAGMDNYHRTGHGPVLNTRIEISALHKSGREFPIELTIFPLELSGSKYFTAFVRDISEIKESKEKMEKALEREIELYNMRTQFIAMTSHELRTPLAVIKSNTELLQYQLDRDTMPEKEKLVISLNRIDNNVDRLNHLVRDIDTIGRFEANEIPFNPEPVIIDEFIKNQILKDFHDRGHGIICFVEGGQFNVEIDKKLFAQVMNNLIENAIKYSDSEKAPEIHVAYAKHLIIEVKDFGIGIPKADQDVIFEKFYRASNVENIKGSGLGLAIVKEIVNRHAAEISVKSIENEGTSFFITITK